MATPKKHGSRQTSNAKEPIELSTPKEKTQFVEFEIEQFLAEPKTTRPTVRRQAAPSLNSMEIHSDYSDAKKELVSWIGEKKPAVSVSSRSASGHKFASENVVGVGIGIKDSAGVFTGELAIKVFVKEKVSHRRIHEDFLIPEEIGGIATDVSAVGPIRSFSYAARYDRPVRSGVSCGHPSLSAGTIGCLVVLKNGRLGLLSNNHVLANENNATVGDAIIQPGRVDGGQTPSDVIGLLEDFLPINFAADNLVDAAVAWTSRSLVSSHHMTYVADPTPIAATPLMTVIKNGRTTQATTGWVEAIDVDAVDVEYDSGIARFNDQIVIRGLSGASFSQGGDSGALIVTSGSRQPVGLLFAGSTTHTFANPIDVVMDRLKIDRIYVE